jgi:murein DD-endopeptidase MepM/ murein hydrolase activator NlpD
VENTENGILAQKLSAQERRHRWRWMLAISAIPLFGFISAFGIAPQTSTVNIPVSTVVEEIALPNTDQTNLSITLETPPLWQIDQVRRDDTLASLLERVNIRNAEAIDFLKHAHEARALATQLRPGHNILVSTTAQGELLSLQYQLDPSLALTVNRTSQGYHAETKSVALENRVLTKSAQIHSSLFAASDEANIPDRIAIQLTNIFSADIDFHLDLRKGDSFRVVYEAGYNNGEMVNTGRVLAAEFANQGKTYSALLYRNAAGREDYYTTEGKSLHKAFLRSPLEFSRISSGFTQSRLHPILKTWRAHKGVDYAAPIGTRIKSTADATVDFVGTKSGYGLMLILKHQGGISTAYGHLSHVAPGLHKGTKIMQGEVIGFVGMSGLATGPHLHYEFRVNGELRNPLKVALPNAMPVPNEQLTDFKLQVRPLLVQLSLLHDVNTVSLD